jgi:hypothetical protein
MFGTSTATLNIGVWNHIAVVRSSSTATKLYVNGTKVGTTYTGTQDFSNSQMVVAANDNGSTESTCRISNLRLTKGQALYTSSFRPSTEPLTTTSQGATSSNVKILACNNSSVTGGTVVPATVNSGGDPTASTDSPFDDPSGFVFGDSKEGIIKCGSYTGNGTSTGPFINLGWEPQWLLIKRLDNSEDWTLYDSMRGIGNQGGTDKQIKPNINNNETTSIDRLDLTATGFNIVSNDGDCNADAGRYMYVCIRRPDGYVGKPIEDATKCFAMDAGGGSSEIPNFDSGFPVDFGFLKKIAVSQSWFSAARLAHSHYQSFDSGNVEANSANYQFDNSLGWNSNGVGSSYQSWMLKRHAGFDVVAANNLPIGATLAHSLGSTPEMIWAKNRHNTFVWGVYHKGLNGGTNPEQYRLKLNGTNAKQDSAEAWNDTAPTATHFTVGVNHTGNSGGADYAPIFFLFASVTGISKVGYYTGTGSNLAITLGFQPRFIILKAESTSGNWNVLDTTRGWASGNDQVLELQSTGAQQAIDVAEPTSTGFTLTSTQNNVSGTNYVYYAHA